MIRGAIFDVDGTLLDSMPIWSCAGERYLRKRGICPEESLGEILFPLSLQEGAVWLRDHYLPGTPEQEIREGILGIIGTFYREEVQAKPGMRELLSAFRERGIPMAAATTGDRKLVEAAFARLDLGEFFAGVLTADELGTSKREPDIYYAAARILGTRPEETLVVEDVLYALLTAKRAGFLTAAAEDEASRAEWEEMTAIADYRIRSSDIELSPRIWYD